MARPEELEAIAEMGRKALREALEAGTVPPFSDDQIEMLRDAGCPSATRKARSA